MEHVFHQSFERFDSLMKNNTISKVLSPRLFQLLGVETRVCLKAGRKYVFGEAETQLLYKSCVLDEGINA